MEKKKHLRKAISLELKIAILDRLAKGERPSAIGRHLHLGESTIRTIKKNEAAIRKSVISGTKLSAKFSSYSRDALLEKTEQALVIWIKKLSQKRIPINGYSIKHKALQFYEQIKQSEPSTSTLQANKQFSASKGWLTGFSKRHAIHSLQITEENAQANEETVKTFLSKLSKIIKDAEYHPDQVFNAVETTLFWKKIPSRTPIAISHQTLRGFKSSKDRVRMLICSNASGDRMLKPLLVNRFLRPLALKNIDLKQLPVHWMANAKAKVTTAEFTEWFNNCFVPEVETYMKGKALNFKVLLIVNNAPGHPYLEHPNVQMMFFPPNTTSLIQPLDQGIITTFKKCYAKCTYKLILNKLEDKSLTVTDIWKKISILDCLNQVSSAIAQISPKTLNACWKAAWPKCVGHSANIQTSRLSTNISTLAHEIDGKSFDTYKQEDIDEIRMDDVLNDDNITAREYDSYVENKPVLLTADKIQEGLQLCSQLENHFLVNDVNFERASKFQRELKNCIYEYRELYNTLLKS